MIYPYRLIYFSLKYLLLALYPILPASLRQWIDLRNKPLTPDVYLHDSYWFHAASGEIEYCKSIIRELKKRNPSAHIVVTYSSPSAEKLFHNMRELVDRFIPICWDSPAEVKKLIAMIKPRLLLFSRTDLWPELIQQCSFMKIPLYLAAFDPSKDFWSRQKLRWLLPFFSHISCTDEDTAHFIRPLNSRCSTDGDTRFDQVFYRLEEPPRIHFTSTSPFLVCGSTWPEDEKNIFPLLTEFREKAIKVVLSPHEVAPENIARIKNKLKNTDLSVHLLSELDASQGFTLDSDVLLIDRIGYLADCYREASIAFVGGSFRKKVHSVMEPLCCGLHVVTGPFFRNNPEAVKYLNRYVHTAGNKEELREAVLKFIGKNKANIRQEMLKNRHATQSVLSYLK